MENLGECECCGNSFSYFIVHNGFNDSAYAHCDLCGLLAPFSRYCDFLPNGLTGDKLLPGVIPTNLEQFVSFCECGGRFRGNSQPRCPLCNHKLSAELARSYIESNAVTEYRWQGNWNGIYSLLIDGRSIDDPWLS